MFAVTQKWSRGRVDKLRRSWPRPGICLPYRDSSHLETQIPANEKYKILGFYLLCERSRSTMPKTICIHSRCLELTFDLCFHCKTLKMITHQPPPSLPSKDGTN